MKSLPIYLTLVFLALTAASFIWGVSYVVMEINRADANQTATSQVTSFDLKDAAALNYHGMTSQ
jgi:hypothetical protein